MDNERQNLSTVIIDYITARGEDKLLKLDKEIDKLKSSANPADQQKLEIQQQKRLDELEKFKPTNWLTDAAKRAGQLQLVTHAPKFTHTDAKGSGMFAPSVQSGTAKGMVDTNSISQPQIDVIGNAAALDVGKLLQLSVDGKALIDYIVADDLTPLLAIATNEEQAMAWAAGLKRAISSEQVSSHQQSKQVYWPISDESNKPQQYHLLAPLFATSLQQSIYQTIQSSRFSETAKQAKAAQKANKPSDIGVVYFPQIAEQHFGGTKPQNISQLNSQRYGKGLLLSAAPPHWQTIAKPPLQVNTIFDGIFNHRAGKFAASLRWYLEQVLHRPSVVEIRDERAERIDQIIDILFAYVGEVHQFDPGWSASAECQLPIAEQLLLDPQRRAFDQDFARAWDKKDWPEIIAASFSRWLNRQLAEGKSKSQQLAPGQVDFVQWRTLIAQKLRILQDDFRDFYIDDEELV